MSLFSRLFNRQQKSLNTGIFGFFAPSAIPQMGEKEQLKAYRGWVYACTNAIAERMADIDLKFQQKTKDGWMDVEEHPALDLIVWVNAFTSFYDHLYATQAFLELNGNSFWYLPRNGKSEPSEIWQLDPTRTEVVKSEQEYIRGYVFTNLKGTRIPFESEEILHFKRFNPTNAYRGMGTVQAAALAVDIDSYASEWQRNFFGNSAMPSGVLSTTGTLTQEQYDRIRANFDAKYRGVQNAHKMLILEGGLAWTSLTPTNREMQFTDGRKNIRDEILGIFRVPKILLGISEDVNYASADKVEYVFSKYVIKPKMKFFVEKLNEFYLPMFKLDASKYRFWFTDPVPENIEQQILVRESGLKNGYLTINEAREEIGKEPIEGGDEIYLPMTLAPISGSNVPEGGEPAVNQNDQKHLSVKKNEKQLKRTQKAKRAEEKYKKEQIALLHKEYLALNKKLRKEILKRMESYKSVSQDTTYLKQFLHQVQKDSPANELVRFLFDNYEDWIALVYNATKEGLSRILEHAGKVTLEELNLEVDFDLQNPRALDWIESHALEASNSYSDTIKEEMTQIIHDGVEQGLNNEKIADSLSQFFDETDDYRAMRIARTEAITAYGQGNLEGYRQSDVISGKYWICDAEACDLCKGNEDDGIIGLDEEFSGGVQCPSQHCNCECSLGGETNENA